MIRFAEKLFEQMQPMLQQAAANTENVLQKAQVSYRITEDAMKELKAAVLRQGFADKEEEILFFKKIKPGFHAELIYWQELMFVEINKPSGSKKLLKSYYFEVTSRLNHYFLRHHQLYAYYKMGNDQLDDIFFLRHPVIGSMLPEYSLDLDTVFSTVNSTRLSEFMAFERLLGYLDFSLLTLGHKTETQDSSIADKGRLHWTASKAQFIELAYALQCSGVFNNGKADVKQVVEWLCHCFGITVTHHYGYFQSMRIRKKDRTPFLKLLIDLVIRRMDESDEFPRFS